MNDVKKFPEDWYTHKGSMGTTLDVMYESIDDIPIVYKEWKRTNQLLLFGRTLLNNLEPNTDWNSLSYEIEQYFINKRVFDYAYTNKNHGFAKRVWLSDCFLKEGEFNNPLSCHYNPRIDSIQIHPGYSRVSIMSLFNQNIEVKTFYFSTYGHRPSWSFDFKKITKPDLYRKIIQDGLEIGISADHGTFIPHLAYQAHSPNINGKIWHDKIKNIISRKTYYINRKIKELSILKLSTKKDADTIIIIKVPKLSQQDLIRLCILSFLDYNYEDSSIKITHKEPHESKIKCINPI